MDGVSDGFAVGWTTISNTWSLMVLNLKAESCQHCTSEFYSNLNNSFYKWQIRK